MNKGLLYRIVTSIGMYYFVVVLLTSVLLAAFGKLGGSEFVTVMLFAVGLALGSNKVADAIDPEDWPSFEEFAKTSLWSRGSLIFLVTYPVIVVLFCLGILSVEFFIGSITGVITMALADRHAAEKIQSDREVETEKPIGFGKEGGDAS